MSVERKGLVSYFGALTADRVLQWKAQGQLAPLDLVVKGEIPGSLNDHLFPMSRFLHWARMQRQLRTDSSLQACIDTTDIYTRIVWQGACKEVVKEIKEKKAPSEQQLKLLALETYVDIGKFDHDSQLTAQKHLIRGMNTAIDAYWVIANLAGMFGEGDNVSEPEKLDAVDNYPLAVKLAHNGPGVIRVVNGLKQNWKELAARGVFFPVKTNTKFRVDLNEERWKTYLHAHANSELPLEGKCPALEHLSHIDTPPGLYINEFPTTIKVQQLFFVENLRRLYENVALKNPLEQIPNPDREIRWRAEWQLGLAILREAFKQIQEDY